MFHFPCLIIFDRISRKSINPYEFWCFFSSILRANDLSIISVCSQGFGLQTICQPLLKVRFFVTGLLNVELRSADYYIFMVLF
ncbi:hypothetical protein Hanom_Chr07g00601411 [Helianthus anomalus]